MMKFYYLRFTNKKFKFRNPDWQSYIWVKFGITHHNDVLKRFDPAVDDGYVKSPLYLDWKIEVEFSQKFATKAEAEAVERYWLTERFPNPGPNKFWVERTLDCPSNNYYNTATGISELRLISIKQLKEVRTELYNSRGEVLNENSA